MRESTSEVDWRHERLRCQLPRHLGPDELVRFPLWPSVVSLFSPRCRCHFVSFRSSLLISFVDLILTSNYRSSIFSHSLEHSSRTQEAASFIQLFRRITLLLQSRRLLSSKLEISAHYPNGKKQSRRLDTVPLGKTYLFKTDCSLRKTNVEGIGISLCHSLQAITPLYTLFTIMPAILKLIVRDNPSTNPTLSPTMIKLVIALVIIIIVGVLLIAALFIIRSHRQNRQDHKISQISLHQKASSKISNHRRLTISRSESIYIYNEKQALINGSSSPSLSPIPEIRITFPEEQDESGKRKSGRVVIVRIGETGGVGLEPCHQDDLPPYQTSDSEKFESLDLERIGGLKELERGPQRS